MNGDIVKTVQNILEELSALKTKVEFVKRLSDELNTETNCKISKLQEYARFIETVSKAIEPARVVNQPRSLNQTVLNNEKRSIAHQQSWQQSHCISGPLDNSTDLLYPDVKIEVNQTAAQHQFGVDSQAGNIALPTTTATASDALKVEAFENEQVANSRPKDGTKERATKETSEEIGAWDLEMEVNDDDLQTDQDDLMCAPCQLSFTSFTSFIEHRKEHSTRSDKPYPCHICDKSFQHGHTLHFHILFHLGKIKVHTCEVCSKSFEAPDELRRHMRSDHSARYYYYYYQQSSSEQAQSEHQKGDTVAETSSDEATATFSGCSKSDNIVTTNSQTSATCRAQKKAVQAEVKPHKCDKCDKRYKNPLSLRFHERTTHAIVKPFPCPHCTKAFRKASTLNEHLQTHHNQYTIRASTEKDS